MTPLFLISTALTVATAAVAHPPYDLVDIGDFVNGAGSAGALGISGAGVAVGGADDEAGRQAFTFANGKLTRLPTPNLPRIVLSEAFHINNAGFVAGNTYDASLRSRAAYWDHDGYHDLGTLGGVESSVIDLNAHNAIIGLSDTLDSFAYFLWLPSPAYGFPAGMNQLSSFFPRSINDAGQMAAQLPSTTGTFHPALWLPEPAYGLPAGLNDLTSDLFPEGALPFAINRHGAIAGGGKVDSGVEHPALWLPEPMYDLPAGWHDLGLVDRDRTAFAWDMNDRGWVVGTRIWFGEPPNEFEDPPMFIQGWLWIPGQGRINLDDLIPASARYDIIYPRAINNRGQIVASAGSYDHGNYRGVVLSLLCPADWNADATLNSADFFDFLAAFFKGNADFNDDGLTNSVDFFDFLSDFFTGCA